MFIITNGHNIYALAATEKAVKDWFTVRKTQYAKQFLSYAHSAYHSKVWPTENAFIAAQLRNVSVHDVDFTGVIDLMDYHTIRAIASNTDTNVTDKFIIMGKEEVKVGEHITAQVIKKSLKSFGKTVIINDKIKRDSNVVCPSPEKFKEMYDQLARINCTVEGWGSITVAPDSLDQYKMTPKMKETFTIKFVE